MQGTAEEADRAKVLESVSSRVLVWHVPSPERGRRIYGLPLFPPTSDSVCICCCACVFEAMRLQDCGVVSLWVCGLVFVGL